MKQVEVQIPSDAAERVRRLADEHGGFAPSTIDIRRDGEPGWNALRVNLPNDRVGHFVAATGEAVGEAELVIETAETLPLRTPIVDVLAVYQSVGTWPAMLFFAAVSGVVAGYGVIFGLPYLLTGAMLIAPLGSPAMVCVVGAAVGDGWMIRRGAVRFAAALALAALVLWQAHAGASFQRADLARRASTLARQAMNDVPGYAVLRSEASFTTGDGDWHAGEGMLLDLVLKRRPEAGEAVSDEALRAAMRGVVERELEGVRTFVDLSTVP